MAIEILINDCGLSDSEAAVYLALFKLGKANAQTVALSCGLPRTTVYGLLQNLLEKDLILQEGSGKKLSFIMRDPEQLKILIDKEKRRLIEKEQRVLQAVEVLKPKFKKFRIDAPKVSHLEGKKEIEKALFRYQPEWQKSYQEIEDPTMWGYQDPSFVTSYKRWHLFAWESRPDNQRIQLFSNQEGLEQDRELKIPRRQVKLFPMAMSNGSSIWIHGTFIVLAYTEAEPHYCTIIQDNNISFIFRALFRALWEVTE